MGGQGRVAYAVEVRGRRLLDVVAALHAAAATGALDELVLTGGLRGGLRRGDDTESEGESGEDGDGEAHCE